jgi:S1-C subfamily serine protease
MNTMMKSQGWMLWAAAAGLGCALWVLGAAETDPRRDAVVEAVARAMPSVVNIGTETVVEVRDPFEELLREYWGPYYRRRPREAQYSLGSGVIIDETGYVLTNDHVVRRANRIWVKLSDESGGKEYEAERVAGAARSDLALLRILAKPGEQFKAVGFAANDDLLLGETVIALGNPFGLGGSVSRGILSSKSRRPAVENAPMGLEDWLQTDAAINPGNSGGPLINLRGELIGINIAVYREGQGIGFAIPVKRVTEGLSEIFSPERAQLWFGARIRPGDQIAAINGKAPRGYIEFIQELNAVGDRQDVALTLQRGGSRQNVSLRLVRESAVFNANLIKQKLGVSVQEITADLAERLGLLTADGLLVAGVEPDSPAAEAGLRREHIVLGVEGQPAASLVAAAKILYAKRKGEKVALDVLVRRQRGMRIFADRWGLELTVR